MVYLDSSALVKLAIEERDSGPLRLAIDGWAEVVSSLISRIELFRAISRAAGHDAGNSGVSGPVGQVRDRATAVLGRLNLLAIDDQVARRAESIEPFSLRSLDAIHLATALSVNDLEALVTYDQRLAQAATANGLNVVSPGA